MTNPIELIRDYMEEGYTKEEALVMTRKAIKYEKNTIHRRVSEENNYINTKNQDKSIMHNL